MKRKSTVLLILLAVAVSVFVVFKNLPEKSRPGPQLRTDNIDEVIAAMTLEEKVSLVVGSGIRSMIGGSQPVVGTTQKGVSGAAGTTVAIPRLGIPFIVLTDGPAGVRINPTRKNDTNTYYATAFPIGTLLASSWDTALVHSVGEAMGNEVLEYGADIILAPGMNIMRNLLCGRNFEYYSEDPVLTGRIAAAMIKGIQSNGVGVSAKHFAVNNQETNRNLNDARITQRALREIYLKGFEIAVKDANPWTVMSSYNKINGVYASHSNGLLTDILRGDWGFQGVVMTDWFGGTDAVQQVAAGNDLQEPGRKKQRKALLKAVKNGTLSEEDLNTSVRRILELVVISPTFKGYNHSDHPDLQAHGILARRAAAEGMILLENNDALPFDDGVKNVALFGTTSYINIAGGAGSGYVNKLYSISIEQGLVSSGLEVNSEVKNAYDNYFMEHSKELKKKKNPLAAIMSTWHIAEFNPGIEVISDAAVTSDIAIITIGRNQGEGQDRLEKDDFLLTDMEQSMIGEVCETFHNTGKKVIVVLNVGGVIETAGWKRKPDALLLTWQGGQEGGNAVTDVLRGIINPSGKLPMTFPVALSDDPSSQNFPQEEFKINYLKGLLGLNKPKKPEEQVRNIDYTYYEEDIYVGYRYFNTFGIEVSYPFGYGLSYTTFVYTKPVITKFDDSYMAGITVTNTGALTGKEIVELYSSAPQNNAAGEPAQELIAFARTRDLSPGESEEVKMTFTDKDLAWFDPGRSSWILSPGDHIFAFSASSRDTKEKISLKIENEKLVEKVNDVLKPEHAINVLIQK